MEQPRLLWTPDEYFKANSNLSHYMTWLRINKNISFSDYQALWVWSVTDVAAFWESMWEYFDIIHEGTYTSVLQGKMPQVKWFEGVRLN
jgi:acetoacetyl-CoA synthetase